MGAETYVNHPTQVQPRAQAAPRRRGFDTPLLVAIVALVIYGLVMLFSASWDYSLGILS